MEYDGGERVSQLVPWNPLLHVSHHFAHLRFLVVDQVTSIWFLSPKAGLTYQAKNEARSWLPEVFIWQDVGT